MKLWIEAVHFPHTCAGRVLNEPPSSFYRYMHGGTLEPIALPSDVTHPIWSPRDLLQFPNPTIGFTATSNL